MSDFKPDVVSEIIERSAEGDGTLAFINRHLPKNRQWSSQIFVALDFDATLVDNDKYNLETDYVTVRATIAAWLGENAIKDEIYNRMQKNVDFDIEKTVQGYISPLPLEQQNALREYLNSEKGKKFSSFEEYKYAMAGQPINKLLAGEINDFVKEKTGEGITTLEYINNTVVKNVEVNAINQFVPKMVQAPIDGWVEALDKLSQDKNIHLAIVTSSEHPRVFSIIFGFPEDLQKKLGFTSEHRILFKKAMTLDTPESWDAFHKSVKATGNEYSAAEEVDRKTIKERKPHGDLHGLAFLESAKKNGLYRYGVIIEDSGSLDAVNHVSEIEAYSFGLAGDAKEGKNGYVAIGFVGASHYDKERQSAKLAKIAGGENITYTPQEIAKRILALSEEAQREFAAKTEGYNASNVAAALAKYSR